MPLRTSPVDALERHRLRATESRGSTCTSARAPTCARSPTRSAATAGRCGAPRSARSRGCRRERILTRRGAAVPAGIDEALARPTRSDGRRRRAPVRATCEGLVASTGGAAVSVGTHGARRSARRDRDVRRRPSRPPARARGCGRSRARPPTVVTFDPHPRVALGYDVELLTTLERRLELLAEAGVDETLVRRVHARARSGSSRRSSPSACCGRSARRSSSRERTSASGAGAARRPRAARGGSGSTCGRCRWSRASRRRGSATCCTQARSSVRRGCSVGRPRSTGTVVGGDERGGTLGFPTANLGRRAGAARARRTASTRAPPSDGRAAISIGDEPALRRRRAANRGLPARLRAAISTAASCVLELWRTLAGRAGLRERGRPRRPDRP